MPHMVCVVSTMLNLSFCSHSRGFLCLCFFCADGSNRFRFPPSRQINSLGELSFGWRVLGGAGGLLHSVHFQDWLFNPSSIKTNFFFFVVYLFERRDLGKADTKFALTAFCPLKELALSCSRIADWLLAQISHKQWAELGKAGGQRYWKQSSAVLKHPQEGLMKPLASYLQTAAKLSNPSSCTDQLQNTTISQVCEFAV